MDWDDLEGIADEATEGLPQGATVEDLVGRAGCRVSVQRTLPCDEDGTITPTGLIIIRAQLGRAEIGRRRMVLAILHELAHWLLRDRDCTHGDVWLLALALAAPRRLVRRVRRHGEHALAALYWSTEVPRWALGTRLEWAAVQAA